MREGLMLDMERGRRKSRRRGAALVLVMIFGVGALMLVSTMMALSDAGAKSQGLLHREKSLHFVARAGVAMAINEINRRRAEGSVYADPTGNGYGCILFDTDGVTEGFPVFGTNGELLGRFRAMVHQEGTSPVRNVLTVVAAWPAFPVWDPTVAGQRQTLTEGLQMGSLRLAACEVEIRRGVFPFDRNAFSVRGNADAGGAPGVTGVSNQVDITGNDVPAVNISDLSTYNTFVSRVNNFGTISGIDPVTGGAATSEPATVTNDEAGLLSEQVLIDIAEGIDDTVDDVLSTGTEINATSIAALTGSLPTGKYYITSTLSLLSSQTLRGSGTLVIAKGLDLVGTLDWTGDVIVANEDDAKVDVKGSLEVTGVLGIQGIGDATNLGVVVRNGGRVAIDGPGGFTILGDNNSSTFFDYDAGARISVDGIMSVLGNDIVMDFSQGAELAVTGSLAIVTPSDATTGVDIEFRNGAQMDLEFIGGSFDSAVLTLGAFFDPDGTILPVSIPGYLERVAIETLDDQDTVLKADRDGDYGF